VTLGHFTDVAREIRGMSDLTHKSFALVALALAVDASLRPRILLEAEGLSANMFDDDDRSYVLSKAAIAWVQLRQYRYALDLGEKTRSGEQTRPYDQMNLYLDILRNHVNTSK